MKLAEAKKEVGSINQKLELNKVALRNGPLELAAELLDHCNALVNRREKLIAQIRLTEEATLMGNNSLAEVAHAQEVITQKIQFLDALHHRKDLNSEQFVGVHQQLKDFRSNRDKLDASIEQCLWETELLDE